MRKQTLYSSSSRSGRAGKTGTPTAAASASTMQAAEPATDKTLANRPHAASGAEAGAGTSPPPAARQLSRFSPRRVPATGWLGLVALAALGLALHGALQPEPRRLTQTDIDRAVLHTLEKTSLPSAARKAFEVIHPSVVRVRGLGRSEKVAGAGKGREAGKDKDKDDQPMSTGTGVIIVESGLILTNLHVIEGAAQIEVTFADGTQSPAAVLSTQPHNDLAVLQPRTVPEDVVPATLRGTADLSPGDTVVAVGFPFGIGPSVSAGVVSGLRREYQALDGKTMLSNLIQFDAAANPGSSGGPLVTAEGEVVGIVTAILNPSEQRVFIGIGFAVPIENAAGGMGLPPH